jgi:hypothetical protein
MAKKPKQITPFFELRFQINDTLEALSHELLMTIQAIETAIDLGAMNDAARDILSERVAALKAVCLSDEEG